MSCSLCFITLHFKLKKRTNNEKKKEEYLEKDTGGRSNKYRCRSIDESLKAEGNGQEISIHKSKALQLYDNIETRKEKWKMILK